MTSTSTINIPTTNKVHKTSSDTWKMFDVSDDIFRRFEKGRAKFSRWSNFLDTSDESQNEILSYAKSNPKNTIILRDSASGCLRQIRRG
jgi:hypothetical protein